MKKKSKKVIKNNRNQFKNTSTLKIKLIIKKTVINYNKINSYLKI